VPSPFEHLGRKVKNQSWVPYEPEQAVRLLNAAKGDLADLIRLAMYSGARREELCALRVEHVKADRFDIVDAKTAAGIRTVPIHREAKATLTRLIGKRREGFLFARLKADKYGRRGDQLGKQFTALKRRLGFCDRHLFHSWRSTVITRLERAGVPESTAQDIVAHERSTLTGSTYSGKSTFEMRRDALAKLDYSA
jgi:integrase